MENPMIAPEDAASAAASEAPAAAHKPGRIHFIDEVRGIDIVLMVAFHAFYTIGWLYQVEWGRTLFRFFDPAAPFFAGLFIFICGISCHLSHSNLRRGLLLAGVSIVISAFLWFFMRSEMIWFGILHFLAIAILLFALLKPLLAHIPPWIGIAACAFLMLITWWVPTAHNADGGSYFGIRGLLAVELPDWLASQNWLYPLGFWYIPSADYFPLLPWLFCFLGGSFVGVWVEQGRTPRWMYKSRLPIFSWLGRHTLIIYILHQPVIYAICLCVDALLR